MNNLSKYLLLSTCLISSFQIYAENEITITGNVLDSTCTLTATGATGNTDTENGDFTLALPTITSSDFINQTSSEETITFRLTQGGSSNQSCDALTATTLLQGMTLSSNFVNQEESGVLRNIKFSGDENKRVDIQVLTNNNTLVNFNVPDQEKSSVQNANSDPYLTYKVRYFKVGDSVEAQEVETKMTYTFSYN